MWTPDKRFVSRAFRHLCVLRTMEGARVSIVLATKYRKWYWDGILEKWRKVTSAFGFVTHLHLSKQALGDLLMHNSSNDEYQEHGLEY